MEQDEFILHNGKKYARVSKIIQHLSDFSKISKNIIDIKSAIGTELHEGIHDFLTNEIPIMSPRTRKYFESFLLWYNQITPTFLQTEQRYFDHKSLFTGCVDGVIQIPGETLPVMIDFKTSSQESPSWRYQAHLYSHLMKSEGHEIASHYLFIQLHPKGALPKVHVYTHNFPFMCHCLDMVENFWDRENRKI